MDLQIKKKKKLNYVTFFFPLYRFVYSICRTIRESSLPKARVDFGTNLVENSLNEARSRAHRAITEETVFDSKGFKVPKIGVPIKSEIENNFDAEVRLFFCFNF